MEAGQTATSERPLEAIEADIAALGCRLAARMASWLDLIAEFDARGGAAAWGFRSTGEWLAWRCGIGARAAREHVRVARRLRELPRTRAALASGALSFSKARAITRAEPQEDEGELLAAAQSSTAAQLERHVRSLRSSPSGDVEVANRVRERRRLDWWWQRDGSLGLHATLPADDGAIVAEAIETAALALMGPPHEGDDRPTRPSPGMRRADALVEMLVTEPPRTQLVVHVDPAALACTAKDAADRAGEICALHGGPAIPSETARRLGCDARIIVAAGQDNGLSVHDLGRSRRVVSPALRASLERRDGGCRYPGCERRHGLHAHHIEHWVHGGATDRDNLVLLCPYHHRLLHEGGFAVERAGAGGVCFRTPEGRVVPPVPDRPPDAHAPPLAEAA